MTIDQKIRQAYQEQEEFDQEKENKKYKSAHKKVFIDVEGGGDDYYG